MPLTHAIVPIETLRAAERCAAHVRLITQDAGACSFNVMDEIRQAQQDTETVLDFTKSIEVGSAAVVEG